MLERIAARAAAERLTILGGFATKPGDGLPEGTQSLLLLGPREPGFWPHLTAQPEWQDGRPDPVDRWSERVIARLAHEIGALPVFPFGGPPWWPFYGWALRTGRAFASPVRLIVHDEAGLFFSCRGALALRERLEPARGVSPCTDCANRPCLTACPVGALGAGGYDVPACHAFLESPDGTSCLDRGCAVRRACPRSQGHARMEIQSAYHMRQFHR
ncbi:ferredoxin [Cereibacter sphaeroides]|uniref:ferredoxin n=1 Tax=Cereibacter sphaeroides TaxID=1063 RepID=UPI000F548C8E|nr:ferredoxin [Cereibacter sphaeroides]AZB62514.1 ferredoxin [Cereibacter sphaeroides]AZB69536.1 ferredoxin [Cereibacter sphaeroides]